MRVLVIFLLLAVGASAQTVIVRTNEVAGNVAPSEEIYGVAGTWRFTLHAVDGGDPAAIDGPVRFVVTDTTDMQTTTSTVTTVSSGYIYRASVTLAQRTTPPFTVPYWVQFVRTDVEDEAKYTWWASVIVTSAPPSTVQASISATSVVTVVNPSNVVSLSLNPLIASNGFLGTPTHPWGEVNAVTGRFSGSLIVQGDLDVSGAITAVDTSKVALAGDTMTGPLTNEAGFWGSFPQLLSNGTATINSQPLTNGASLTIASGGLQLWVERTGTTTQVGAMLNTTNQTQLGRAGLFVATNQAIAANMPDNTVTGGAPRGTRSVDWQVERSASDQIASGGYSVIGGGRQNRASGLYSIAIGGQNNSSDGQSAFVGGGSANQAQVAEGVVVGGSANLIMSGGQSAIVGGQGNIINVIDPHAAIVAGYQNQIDGNGPYLSYGGVSIIMGYQSLMRASADSIILSGFQQRNTNTLYGVMLGGEINTNINSLASLVGVGFYNAIKSSTNAAILTGQNNEIRGITNAVILGGVSVLLTNANYVAAGNMRLSMIGTNAPPITGAFAFADENLWVAVSNQWRRVMYE